MSMVLISPFNIEVTKGDHIAIIGPNGIGKSTLIKTVAGIQPKLNGEITTGANLKIGYYDQKQAEFKSSKTILDYLWDQYPSMNEKDIRAVLGRFLFVQEDVKKIINDLSGGEKARLQLALLMLERNNVLILDEPTNHLDIDSKEMLEQALDNFEGTILFVSHDRYFINQLANKVYDLDTHGGTMYLGNYQYFIEKKEENEAIQAKKEYEASHQTKPIVTQNDNYIDQKLQKREQRQIERQIDECETEIDNFETKISEINELLTLPDIYSDPEEANRLAKEKESSEQALEQVMSKWAELQEKLI